MGLLIQLAAGFTRICALVAVRCGLAACGGLRSLLLQEHSATRYRSRWWFVLPLMLNLLGGIIAYLAIRHDDPDKAKNCLLAGLAIFAALVTPWVLVWLLSLVVD